MRRADVQSLLGTRAVGYLRVSTDRQAATDKVSLQDQRAAIEKKAAELGLTIAAWFTDPGASGGSFEKRDGMRSLIASCEAYPRSAREPGTVFVMTASRFGRPDDPEESAYWRQHLKRVGWIVRYTINDDSTDVGTRHLMRAISDVSATNERNEIKRRAISGSRGATEGGYWAGGCTPFGYVRKAINRHTGIARLLPHGAKAANDERVRLQPDESGPAQLIRTIFEKYAAGELATHGLTKFAKGEWPAVRWTPSQIARILKQPVYVGDLVSGKRTQSGQGYGCQNAHPAIVERELFEQVQVRLRHNAGDGRGVRGRYALTGLVRCAICGSPLIGAGSNGRVDQFGQRKKSYRCRGTAQTGTPCHMGGATVTQSKLEDAVRSELAAEFRTAAARAAVWREIERALAARDTDPAPKTTDAIDRSLAEIERQIQRVIAGFARGLYTDHEAESTLSDLRTRLASQQRARADIVRLADHRIVAVPSREHLRAMVDAMPALLESLTGADFRGAVIPWIRSATFDPRGDRPLTLEIRCVPCIVPIGYSRSWDGECNTTQPDEPVVIRTVNLGRYRGGK